nr:PilZ domain-containing protein [Desulfobulbaceae bacterium]
MAGKTTKRKHPRVTFTGKVDLLFPDIEYLNCEALNISLIGILVLGCQEQEDGTQCDIEFHDSSNESSRRLCIKGEVVRSNEDGIALLFRNMNVRTFTDLEEFVKNQAGDTYLDTDEFLDALPAEMSAL